MDDSVDGLQEGYLQEEQHQDERLQEVGADHTMCMSHDPELLAPLFPSKSAAFNLDGISACIFDMATSPLDPEQLAVVGSDHVVKIYNRHSLLLTTLLQGHSANIVGASFSRTTPHLLWTCAQDKTVRLWDLRDSQRPQQTFKIFRGLNPSSFDVNCLDSHFAVGTEQSGGDSHVQIYDVRTPKPMADLDQAHSDDVTQVRYHPERPSVCISGATDGLVNVYDLASAVEDVDDYVVQTLNSESSVGKLGFFGPQHECIYCLTHTETLMLWHLLPDPDDDSQPELISRYPALRDAMNDTGVRVDYLVDCRFNPTTQRLFLVGGSFTGNIEVMHVNIDSVSPLLSMYGGHHDTVRCVDWDTEGHNMVSGDESSLLCSWSNQPNQPAEGGEVRKMAPSTKRLEQSRKAARPY